MEEKSITSFINENLEELNNSRKVRFIEEDETYKEYLKILKDNKLEFKGSPFIKFKEGVNASQIYVLSIIEEMATSFYNEFIFNNLETIEFLLSLKDLDILKVFITYLLKRIYYVESKPIYLIVDLDKIPTKYKLTIEFLNFIKEFKKNNKESNSKIELDKELAQMFNKYFITDYGVETEYFSIQFLSGKDFKILIYECEPYINNKEEVLSSLKEFIYKFVISLFKKEFYFKELNLLRNKYLYINDYKNVIISFYFKNIEDKYFYDILFKDNKEILELATIKKFKYDSEVPLRNFILTRKD